MTLAKTTAGHQVLKDRSSGLSPRQRAALILLDGKRSLEEVLAVIAQRGGSLADIHQLVAMGLLAGDAGQTGPAPVDSGPMGLYSEPAPLTEPAATSASQAQYERYLRAYKVAVQLTAELGPRHAGLHLAVEAAGSPDELLALEPHLRAAVPPRQFARFEAALHGH